MRRNKLRALGARDQAIGAPSEKQMLERTMLAIAAESGGLAPKLLALIDTRADGVSAYESADFILRMWRDGGTNRDRLIAKAMKSPERNALEKRVGAIVQTALMPLGRTRGYSVERMKDVVRELVKSLTPLLPDVNVERIRSVASSAIDYRPDRMAVRIELIADLFEPPTAQAS